jgi:hypothetical protein
MLYREIIAVFSGIHTKHINTVCGQNGEFMNVKLGDTQPPVQWVPGLSRGKVRPEREADPPPLLAFKNRVELYLYSP